MASIISTVPSPSASPQRYVSAPVSTVVISPISNDVPKNIFDVWVGERLISFPLRMSFTLSEKR